ncbi:hypothetical protein GIB67_012087 [Kingdonia uniflora]|uniref:Uncharacterized protein n=1 Tax=Kingdonia uniflora TaxID=39325 RepID=A0A7J7LI59_9MAGN|nr:hypothetical protein GIB67_012087 [Kingdonia uniflora]
MCGRRRLGTRSEMFQDKLGNICEGYTDFAVIRRELPKQLRQEHAFNIEAGKQALRNINLFDLFSNIEVNPRPGDKNDGGIIIELIELEQKTAEVSTEWSIVPGRQGRPTLASIQPSETFKFEYVHPYVDGVYNPRNRTFRSSAFNSCKLSPVFTGDSETEEVPPIWVDWASVKANFTENFIRHSKFTYGLVAENITTLDENSNISQNGQWQLPNEGISADGPPTTLCETGVDQMVFGHANITRDNTKVPVLQPPPASNDPNTHVYSFAKHGNDLRSSKDVKGNPTVFYRRLGHGSSHGVGVKLGLVCAEYAIDHDAGTGAAFLRDTGLLKDSMHIAVEEKQAIFMTSNRAVNSKIQHSAATTSKIFHEVLDAMMIFQKEMTVPPKFDQPPGEITHNKALREGSFKGAVGAIDGTLISASIAEDDKTPYRGRGGGECFQNVMAIYDY